MFHNLQSGAAAILVGVAAALLSPPALAQKDCGECRPDTASPTGASHVCDVEGISVRLPCEIPPPQPPAPSVLCDKIDENVEHCKGIFVARRKARVEVYQSYPLSSPNPSLTRAAIVIHGNGRNAGGAFRAVLDSARAANHLADTLILAPKFAEKSENSSDRWNDDWKEGEKSRNRKASSFEVIDELYEAIDSVFQNIVTVTVAGHSAGGQFVNRYAAAGRGPDSVSGIFSRFLVLNPSSYLYLDDRRYLFGRFLSLNDPEENDILVEAIRQACRGFNRYRYGLDKLNDYAESVGAERMRDQLTSRDVTYLAGSLDTRTDDDLDDNCAAQMQGGNRLSRWGTYAGYARKFSDEWAANSAFEVVLGVGHDAGGMYDSETARRVLFERIRPTPDTDGELPLVQPTPLNPRPPGN